MKCIISLLLVVNLGAPLMAQDLRNEQIRAGGVAASEGPSLPVEKVGPEDLLGVSVYDAPEISHPVRVEADGAIRLPMVKRPIQVTGLYPAEVEKAITNALVGNNVLVDPVVTVSVLEYRSRPIIVAGAVRTPITFQDDGTVTLLDALSRAGGISENAGAEILVSHRPVAADGKGVTEHIAVRSLVDLNVPGANLELQAGDIVRVPLAGQVYVVGDVNKPGPFYITDGSESSILKALAISGGLSAFSSHTAYIYRVESGRTDRTEIPIKLKEIMQRKSPDVPLMANDIFYVPDATGRRIGAQALATSLGLGVGAASVVVYATR